MGGEIHRCLFRLEYKYEGEEGEEKRKKVQVLLFMKYFFFFRRGLDIRDLAD